MDPDGGKIEIHHDEDCRCVIDGAAIYVVAPCYVVGRHVTKRRISQLLHSLRKRKEHPMTNDKNWFEVDRKGLAKLLERRGGPGGGKIALLHELISNAWDADGVTTVEVTLTPEAGVPKVWITVTDDAPDGFKELRHAWALFAESQRKGDAEKRGRFNLGEKLVLALCEEAQIVTTTGGVMFDQRGRTTLKKRTAAGSEFDGLVKMTRAETDEIIMALANLIVPDGVTLTVNGQVVEGNQPVKVLSGVTLPTEIADDEGILRRSARQCKVEIHEHAGIANTKGWLYEMGIPVVETGDRWSVNVMQKVPLNMERDNVTPAYLRAIRTLVVNAMHDALDEDDASTTMVSEALADKDVSPEAVERALDLRFGQKRAIWDPTDLEANNNLVAQGFTLIKGPQLTKAQWDNVKTHGNVKPAGQIAPTKKAVFSSSPDAKDVWLPREKWTPGIKRVVAISEKVCEALIDETVVVNVLSDVTLYYSACFGKSLLTPTLTFNLGRLGHSFFNDESDEGQRRLWQLLIHEVGHYIEPNHLSDNYHEALCRLGAKLTWLMMRNPQLFSI